MVSGTRDRALGQRLLPGSAKVALAASLYLLWTIVTTWPLTARLGSGVPHDLGDPLLVSWFLWWDSHVLPLTERWWNAPMFYPTHGAMAFSEHFLGTTLLVAPIVRLSGNIQLAYNVAFVLTFLLSALAAYALCFAIVRRHDAAFVAGLAFGFAPYRWSQLPHLHVLSTYWMPVTLLALHRYFEDRRARWLVLFACAWVMQALSCGYFLFYGSVLVGLWLLWFAVGRARAQDYVRIAVAWGVGALILAPIAYGYHYWQTVYGFSRWVGEIEGYSADVASLLNAPDALRFWSWVAVFDRPEAALFPGLAVPLVLILGVTVAWRQAGALSEPRLRINRWLVIGALALIAAAVSPLVVGPWQLKIAGKRLLSVGNFFKPFSLAALLLTIAAALLPSVRSAWRRRSALGFYVIAAFVMWVFSLGPSPTIMGNRLMYKAPYAWLMLLPGVDGVRVPARFWMLAALCLAVAAGIAFARLASLWPRYRLALLGALCVGIAADGWPSRIDVLAPPDARPVHTEAVARLELPFDHWHDITAVYRSIQHRRPLINGYSGYFPAYYWPMQYALVRYDPEVLTRLSAWGPIEIVVDHDRDEAGEWRRFVARHPQVQTAYSDPQYTTYRLEGRAGLAASGPTGEMSLPPRSFAASTRASIAGRMTDGDLWTRWDTGHAQRPGDSLTVDLGQAREVTSAELQIGGFVTDFPRQLRIETSLDGQDWREAWTGAGALVAFAGALEDPRAVPLRFRFEPRSARYLRFTQTGMDETYYWSISELRITGK